MRYRTGVTISLLALIITGPQAMAGKVGPEFTVTKSSNELLPHVTTLKNGGFVVTWQDLFSDPAADTYSNIAKRFTAAGTPVGNDFSIGDQSAFDPGVPLALALKGGGFTILYCEDSGCRGQRYTAAGVAAGIPFQIIAMDSAAELTNGSFVVVKADQNGINGQRYTDAGRALSGPLLIPSGDLARPSVAALASGGFVVVWEGPDGHSDGIFGQRYTADGVPIGATFQVNTHTANNQTRPVVAGLANGSFAVTWVSTAQDGSGDGVYAQRYNPAGVRAGGEFRINSYTRGDQNLPAIAALSDGGFVVTWQSNGQDGSGDGVYGQRYTAGARVVGTEFRVNTTTKGFQADPTVAGLSSGGFVAVWDSGSGFNGQRYSAAPR
jgi:hypothetical protein